MGENKANLKGFASKFPLLNIYTTKSEPILSKTDRLPRHRRGRNSAKIGGRAKIPSPKTPSFLPARLCPLRGRATTAKS